MKKVLIKHKLFFYLFIGFTVIFGTPALMINLNKNYTISDAVNGAIGVGVAIFGVFWLISFFGNFSKIIGQEKKNKVNKVKKIAKKGKVAVLVKRRTVSGNLLFIFGLLSIYTAWLIFFPLPCFNSLWFWVFRAGSVVLTIIGAILSFVAPLKMLVYKDGIFIIDNGEAVKRINPEELSEYKKIYYKRSDNCFATALYYDLALTINDEEIILKKADSEYDFCFDKIINTIKSETNKTFQSEREI
ncbi:MAG: hypothetical protein IJQ07_07970 [Clostridia bacterium]|nr:hypothetical protein [Clostridia bacterium]